MTSVGKQGELFLIPAPLGEVFHPDDFAATIRQVADKLSYFVVENEKTAQHFLKRLGVSRPIAELHFQTLNEHTRSAECPQLLKPLEEGHDAGLISEAGCSCIADPGAALVRLAHQAGIKVTPLAGPCSITMALMASGLNGQSFTFHGYLPVEPAERRRFLQQIEAESLKSKRTQIFMDTPYRTRKVVEEVLAACAPGTLFCVAANITQPNAFIETRSIAAWQAAPPQLGKDPAMFLLSSGN